MHDIMQNLLCDTKSGPPYLAMTHLLLVEKLLATQDLKENHLQLVMA
jgi:hypothetical protein